MLIIPEGYANWILAVDNNGAGVSARSTFALATDVLGGVLSQTDVNRIANIFRDSFKPLWDNGWEVGPVKVYEGTNIGARVWEDPTQETCTHSADTYAPPQIAHVVSKGTGFVGRKYRGRCYLPGVPQGYAGEGGGLNPTRQAEVNAQLFALETALFADSKIEILYLLHDDQTPSVPDPTPISSLLCRDYLGTMRPRNRAV